MIILGKFQNLPLTISIKPQCLTISLEDGKQTDVSSFDNYGRLWTALSKQISYRRGLDGKTVARWVDADGQRQNRWLTPFESEAIAAKFQTTAVEILAGITAKNMQFEIPFPDNALKVIKSAAEFDQNKRETDISEYNRIYLPVGILPPDQYGAVVLQATEGCSFNACNFCNFYRDRSFRIKDPSAFETHCQNVKTFLDAGLGLRRTIFLGDANALVLPTQQLIKLFEITHKYFDVQGLGGIYAFLDGLAGERKSGKDYASLVKLGLKRVYIGLESGNASLLHYLNKPSTPDSVINTVRALKMAGTSVGVIILLGAGGKKFERRHVIDTIRVLNHLSLDAEDIVYFSELFENAGMGFQKNAYQEELQPLTHRERTVQGEEIENGLLFRPSKGIPHISRYDIREFVY